MPSPKPNGLLIEKHSKLLIDSFLKQTRRSMPKIQSGEEVTPELLFLAHYAVVSHGAEQPPLFNYGNQTALNLFELDWQSFTKLPSQKSAEPVTQTERDRLLARVSENGFIDDYQGIRISASGKRFRIEEAVVWNVVDESETYRGQAALLTRWAYL